MLIPLHLGKKAFARKLNMLFYMYFIAITRIQHQDTIAVDKKIFANGLKKHARTK